MSDTIPSYPTTDVSVRTTRVVFLTFVLLVVVYRVVMLLALDVPLFYDEAYYFGWAQELAFGYFSKPPMVAWSIALTTIATDSSWAVRLSSQLVMDIEPFVHGLLDDGGRLENVRFAEVA